MINVYLPDSIFQPPLDDNLPVKKLFLAGTIEMGNSEDWQAKIIKNIMLSDVDNVNIFNPRRVIFDQNDSEEIELQINWELDRISNADVIFMNLCANTISPISLLEIGLIISLIKQIGKEITFIIHVEYGYSRTQNVLTTLSHHAFYDECISLFVSTENESKYETAFNFLIDTLNG